MATARRLFGTDGVRGVAGEFLTDELAFGLGRAAAAISPADTPQVLIVRDTRESGERLEASLASGVAAAGGHALLGGVLPTPGAALLTRRYGFDLAAVVSASHNPYCDNGIKFFGPDGTKLDDGQEADIEAILGDGERSAERPAGLVRKLRGAERDYLRELELRFRDLDLAGRRILLDCANGATYRVAPQAFRRLKAEVDVMAADPDGRNINAGCGSTHVGVLAQRVVEGGYELGFAFDGDGDRVLAVDRSGAVVDGDELLALAGVHLREGGRLTGNGIVVTVMTNFGFHQAMNRAGVEVATTAVGDRHVLAELLRRGWVLGGEQSGHIIDTGFVPAGDGTGAALLTLEALNGGDLGERNVMTKLPQLLVNVEVARREGLDTAAEVWCAVERESRALDGRGRVLLRPSGTEPLVRVMVEAPDQSECEEVAGRLTSAVKSELG